MKKIPALFVTVSLAAMILAACGGKAAEQPTTTEAVAAETTAEQETESVDPGMFVGGWQLNDDETVGWATEEAKEAFDKALEGFTGADYEIISLLGSQVVSGTNYEFLCKKTIVVPDATPALSFVVVYKDLQGNAKINHVEDLELGMFYGAENPAGEEEFETLVGGWTIPESIQAVNLPAEVASAYDEAMANESDYYPVAYLGHQLVSGNNYAVLCFDEKSPCLVYIYKPLNGDAELTNIYRINMSEFSGN